MKKLFLLIILASAGFTGKTMAQTATLADPNGPMISFTDKSDYDFGKIKQGEVVKKDFAIRNTGKQPLIITEITTPCGCTTPEWPKAPIAPGKSAVIHVEFNSANKLGPQSKELKIKSNSREGEETLTLSGEVLSPDTK